MILIPFPQLPPLKLLSTQAKRVVSFMVGPFYFETVRFRVMILFRNFILLQRFMFGIIVNKSLLINYMVRWVIGSILHGGPIELFLVPARLV